MPKKLKNCFPKMLYSLKAHAHYFTVFIYLAAWRAAKLGFFTYFMFRNLPWCSQSMNSLIYVYPMQICSQSMNSRIYVYYMQILSCFLWVLDHSQDHIFFTTAIQNNFLYYPLGWLQYPTPFSGLDFETKQIRYGYDISLVHASK